MTDALDEKHSYEELTDKQQRVVDELAEEPTAQNQEIADRADVSRSTVYNVKEKYGEIVKSQLDQVGRYDGTIAADGDPFGDEIERERNPQSIGERPAAHDRGEEKFVAEGGVLGVRLHRADIEQMLITGNVSEDFRRQIVDRLLESAFDDSEE